MLQKLAKLYEGKAKIIYETDNPSLIIQHFKDDATAFNGKKKGQIQGKGAANARISLTLFSLLEGEGVKTHYKELLSETDMLVDKLQMIPIEVIVRNVAAGSLAERLGYEEGRPLSHTVVEFYYKNDALGDPLLNWDHIQELKLATPETLRSLKEIALKINDVLKRFFDERDLELVDFKLEFGYRNGEIVLGDEISPDTCRFWDKKTGERLDKDRFRRDLGKVEEAYQEVLKRVVGEEVRK
jgi:phosphoribosylaminoimidazole-succinocarboxamide synthase